MKTSQMESLTHRPNGTLMISLRVPDSHLSVPYIRWSLHATQKVKVGTAFQGPLIPADIAIVSIYIYSLTWYFLLALLGYVFNVHASAMVQK